MCRLIIAGSRSVKDYNIVRQAIIDSGFWKKYGRDIEVVCGMAEGVDLFGKEFAERNGLVCHEYPADWKNLDAPNAVIRQRRDGKYNAKAGHDRNYKMALNADALLAIWDGYSKGTKDMIRIAEKEGLEIFVYKTY